MTDNLKPELAPCPFCGGTPELSSFKDGNSKLLYAINCDMKDCPTNPAWATRAEKDAIAAWNRRTEPAGSAEPSDEQLAKMLVSVANDDSIPKLNDEEIRAICQSRGWSLNDTPTLRELAHVFYAEGCAAQRRTQSAGSAEPSDENMRRYEELEREHLGDPDKRTGIYTQSTHQPDVSIKAGEIDLSDAEIERIALKHIATHWGKIGPGGDYRKTEQFKRIKAYTLELLAAKGGR